MPPEFKVFAASSSDVAIKPAADLVWFLTRSSRSFSAGPTVPALRRPLVVRCPPIGPWPADGARQGGPGERVGDWGMVDHCNQGRSVSLASIPALTLTADIGADRRRYC